jgi:2-C-methyl-D-erythritol 4-phosphate cytidylyltransferase
VAGGAQNGGGQDGADAATSPTTGIGYQTCLTVLAPTRVRRRAVECVQPVCCITVPPLPQGGLSFQSLRPPGYADAARVITARYPRVLDVIDGGAERSDSTVRALAWLDARGLTSDLLIHDAARPLLTGDVIDRCIAALAEHVAVGVAVPSSDTVFRTDPSGRVVEVPPRSELWRAQTPQGFRLATLRAAYDAALADPAFVATDDCSVVLRYLPDVAVTVVLGDERNMKVTGPLDLAIAERLLSDS